MLGPGQRLVSRVCAPTCRTDDRLADWSCIQHCSDVQFQTQEAMHARDHSPELRPETPAHATLASSHLGLALKIDSPVVCAGARPVRGLRTEPTVDAALLSEVLLRKRPSTQGDVPLAANGVLRYVWESRFGPMLIEVRESKAYVNGQVVEPSAPGTSDGPSKA